MEDLYRIGYTRITGKETEKEWDKKMEDFFAHFADGEFKLNKKQLRMEKDKIEEIKIQLLKSKGTIELEIDNDEIKIQFTKKQRNY